MTRRTALVRAIGYVAVVLVACLVVAAEGGDALALLLLVAVTTVTIVIGVAVWTARGRFGSG